MTDLPGYGDHQTDYLVVGPDGKLYWGQGSVTNTGVVGADVVLAGRNYAFRNVLGNITEEVQTGAFVPFGTPTHAGQVITGDTKCTRAILRCDLDGSNIEGVAWGLRNPYGVAFDLRGQLFATEHGSDERGGRYIVGDFDDLYEIREGAWYGWPDFASGIRLDEPYWGQRGQGRKRCWPSSPDPSPPRPFVS